jgi:hypothetical protein
MEIHMNKEGETTGMDKEQRYKKKEKITRG